MTKKTFNKKIVKKTKRTLRLEDAQQIIQKEFMDNKGSKVLFLFDFRPHSTDKPTIQWQRKYNKEDMEE